MCLTAHSSSVTTSSIPPRLIFKVVWGVQDDQCIEWNLCVQYSLFFPFTERVERGMILFTVGDDILSHTYH
jgi:hypothetical protein